MLVAGVGINDSPEPVTLREGGKQTWKCPVYSIWQNMLHRCYPPYVQAKHPTYIGVKVCDAWLSFNNFRLWANEFYKEGYDLDKDILSPGCKVYSPETCMFIPRRLNVVLMEYSKPTDGGWPMGVSPKGLKFLARVNNGSTRIRLGLYKTPEDAHKGWQAGKIKILEELLLTIIPAELKSAWQKIIDKLKLDMHNGIETTTFKEI